MEPTKEYIIITGEKKIEKHNVETNVTLYTVSVLYAVGEGPEFTFTRQSMSCMFPDYIYHSKDQEYERLANLLAALLKEKHPNAGLIEYPKLIGQVREGKTKWIITPTLL